MKKVNEKEFNHGLGISREQIHTVRHKLRAAAYGTKGVNLSKEFARMDKNHDGVLTYVLSLIHICIHSCRLHHS